MEQPKQVVPNNNAGLLAFVFSILKLPFSIGNVIYTYLFTKELKNCLPGKVVVITGASSGLGEALAHTFYIAGCKVVLCARQQNELERVRKDLLQQHSVSFIAKDEH
jgi:dehydrogenase/reductase SDR family member 7B